MRIDHSPPKTGKDLLSQDKNKLQLIAAKSTAILNNHTIMVDKGTKLNKYSKAKQDRDLAELKSLLE